MGVYVWSLFMPLIACAYYRLLHHEVKASDEKELNIGCLTIYCPCNDSQHIPYLITANNSRKQVLSSFTPRLHWHTCLSWTIEYYQPLESYQHALPLRLTLFNTPWPADSNWPCYDAIWALVKELFILSYFSSPDKCFQIVSHWVLQAMWTLLRPILFNSPAWADSNEILLDSSEHLPTSYLYFSTC